MIVRFSNEKWKWVTFELFAFLIATFTKNYTTSVVNVYFKDKAGRPKLKITKLLCSKFYALFILLLNSFYNAHLNYMYVNKLHIYSRFWRFVLFCLFSIQAFPVEIIPNLYLGNAAISAELSILERHNIKHILNVTPDLPNVFESSNIRYLQIPISDHWSQTMLSYFPSAIQFIGKSSRLLFSVLWRWRLCPLELLFWP